MCGLGNAGEVAKLFDDNDVCSRCEMLQTVFPLSYCRKVASSSANFGLSRKKLFGPDVLAIVVVTSPSQRSFNFHLLNIHLATFANTPPVTSSMRFKTTYQTPN